jgi:aminopeptidase N
LTAYFDQQERFVLINNTVDNQTSPVWWIPVSYTTASEKDFKSTSPKLWLRGEKAIHVNITVKKEDWFIANIQQTGNLGLHLFRLFSPMRDRSNKS